jgi:hypothetical protein
MEGCARQLIFLKSLLQTFATSTGLKVNYSKSMMVPINIEEGKMSILPNTFGSSIGSMPFTYLGLPLALVERGALVPVGEGFRSLKSNWD